MSANTPSPFAYASALPVIHPSRAPLSSFYALQPLHRSSTRTSNPVKDMQRQRTPNTATLLTTLAFSGDVKVLYALAKYPFGAGRRGSALWTTMRCCFGAIDSFEWVLEEDAMVVGKIVFLERSCLQLFDLITLASHVI
jgi:hypothetical protein